VRAFLKSLSAVAAGYVVMNAILGLFAPTPGDTSSAHYFLLTLAWTIVGAIAAGFVAAILAGRHEIPHAAGVGFLLIVWSLWSMHRQGITRPGWIEIIVAGCGPIAAMIGAALRMLTKKSKTGRPRDLPAGDNPQSASQSNPSTSRH
jgi:hypothetical protein